MSSFRFSSTIAIALVWVLWSSEASASTLHAILLTDVDDARIGESVKVDLRRMKDEIRRIVAATGMTLRAVAISSPKFNVQKTFEAIQNSPVKKDDVFLFYFSGHGLRTTAWKNEWPYLWFPNGPGIFVDDVIREIENMGPRLSIVLTDSCNTAALPAPGKESTNKDAGEGADGYKDLFINSKGKIVANSSSPGEAAVGTKEKGGLFTDAFLNALRNEASSTCASWDTVMRVAGKAITFQGNTQTPFHETKVSLVSRAEKEVGPVCQAPAFETPPPASAQGNAEGWFEGRTGRGKLSLQFRDGAIDGTYQGTTSVMGVAPEGGRRVELGDGSVVTSSRGTDGTGTEVELADGAVTIRLFNADGSVTTTVQRSEGFDGSYRFETSGHHPQYPDRRYDFSKGIGYWHKVSFEGRVASARFNGDGKRLSGNIEGRWTLSTEHCGADCGPTSGPATGAFSGTLTAGGVTGQIGWTVSGLKEGAVFDGGSFETSGALSIRLAPTPAAGNVSPQPAPSAPPAAVQTPRVPSPPPVAAQTPRVPSVPPAAVQTPRASPVRPPATAAPPVPQPQPGRQDQPAPDQGGWKPVF